MNSIKLKNKIQLIAVDLDATLLTSEKTVTEFTQQILNKCRQQGILITIASARPVRAVDIYLDAIKPDAKVCHNGGITFNKNTVINHYQIPPKTAHDIVSSVKKKYPQIEIACDLNESLYTNFDASVFWDSIEYIQTDFSKPFTDSVDKVILNIEEYPDFSEYINTILPSNVYVDIADNKLAYIMNSNSRKHKGLSLLLDHLNISAENVACFGDDTPDIGMIKLCGAGVAMENAKDSVKASADYICPSNDDDGVAKWLEENVLSND